VLVISGSVYGLDTQQPIQNCFLEIWQANADGHYDNEDPAHPPAPNSYTNRARLMTDEHGFYQFETIYSGPYKMDPDHWRAPHIHYMVEVVGYQTLITQLFFVGGIHNDTDPFIKPSLIIPLSPKSANGGSYSVGSFPIVLAPQSS
jgi:catechol 1,2-dioxygenase